MTDDNALTPAATPARPGELAAAEADCYRNLLSRALAALEATAEGRDPAEAVTDLPALLADIRRVLTAPSPPANLLSAPLSALLSHCRRKAQEKRRAVFDLKARAASAPTAQAAAYWRRRASAAQAKPGPWRSWAMALYRVGVGRTADRELLRGLLCHCVRQYRRSCRDEAKAAPWARVRARHYRVTWEVRAHAVEGVLAGLASNECC